MSTILDRVGGPLADRDRQIEVLNAELQARSEIISTSGKVIDDGQKTITDATELLHKLSQENTRPEKLSSSLHQEFESRSEDLRALERSLEAMIQNQTDELTPRTCINGFQVLGERRNRMAEAQRLYISELERRRSERHKKIDALQAYIEGLPQKIQKQVNESDPWKLGSANSTL
jgi:chromosome segregation ATPase